MELRIGYDEADKLAVIARPCELAGQRIGKWFHKLGIHSLQ